MSATITVTTTNDYDARGIRELVWQGAKDRVDDLTDEQIEVIIENLVELYPDGIDETELNDFLWFDDDTYAEWLGFNDAGELWESVYPDSKDDDEEVSAYDLLTK